MPKLVRHHSMTPGELLNMTAQAFAVFVIALPACGFLILSRLLAPFGIPISSLPKAQMLAAGFVYIFAAVIGPLTACWLALWFTASRLRKLTRAIVFSGFVIVFESFVLDQIFLSLHGKLTSGPIRWLLVLLAVSTAFTAVLTSKGRFLARKIMSGPATRPLPVRFLRLTAISFSVITCALYLWCLRRISPEAFLIILFLSTLGLGPVWLLGRLRYIFIQGIFITVTAAAYMTIGLLIASFTCFQTDNAWGGEGRTFADVTLQERSGMLAACTWPVRLLAESDSDYYLTLQTETGNAYVYRVAKSKTSGLHIRPDTKIPARNEPAAKVVLPTPTPFESDECKRMRIETELLPPH